MPAIGGNSFSLFGMKKTLKQRETFLSLEYILTYAQNRPLPLGNLPIPAILDISLLLDHHIVAPPLSFAIVNLCHPLIDC